MHIKILFRKGNVKFQYDDDALLKWEITGNGLLWVGSYSHFNSRLVRRAVEWEITGG